MTSQSDPRFLRSREAIVNTARELLLEHGPTAVTHGRIAEQSGIGRATVYRHWPRTDQLLAEAMATVEMPFFDEPSSPYRDWLTRELTSIARQLDHDDVLAVTTTLTSAALWDPEMNIRRARFAHVLATRLAHALDQAQQAGELTMAIDSADAAALTLGPIVYRAVIEHAPTNHTFVERCVRAAGIWIT